jgi:hypothetical protein
MTDTNGSGVPRLSALHRYLSDESHQRDFRRAVTRPPDSIHQWLAHLVLLTGVPFEYLVPDEAMLPQESVRFFFVDENWIERMIDGALSVVARTELDQLITDTLHTTFRQPVADSVVARVRPRLLGMDPASIEPEPLNWPLTGFLIRSVVAANWKGMVIENTSRNDPATPLTTLRLDQPAQGVILGLYNGQLGSVTFKHPPESLHFGIDGQEDEPQTWIQNLRKLETGTHYDPLVPVDVKFHGDTRVIDVLGTRSAMQSALTPAPEQFTSAELAIEMIESPRSVTFEMSYPTP